MLCLFLNGSYAQTQFPDKNGEWYISYTGDGDKSYIKQPIFIEKDTVIKDKNYSIMTSLWYRCAIRNEYPKVYYMDLNHPENNENLLYDFSLSLGDSVELIHDRFGVFWDTITWHVIAIENWEINKSQRKVIKLFSATQFDVETNYWIEGIGSTMGPVYPLLGSWSEISIELYCYKENGNPIYGDCSLTSNKQFVRNEPKIVFLTNQKLLVIQNEQKKYDLTIYNYLGKMVYETHDCSDENIDLNGFHPGVYICHFTIENQTYSQKIIIS
jgi:hypothetical protein